MIQGVLVRFKKTPTRVLGHLFLYQTDPEHHLVGRVCTLELPDLGNQHYISCIPQGHYSLKLEKWGKPKKDTWAYRFDKVKDRDGVLIHPANYVTQILGCVAVGQRFEDLNKDGELDVADSRKAIEYLKSICGEEFELDIVDSGG